MTQIDCPDRWQAYFRLCELGVTCRCRSHQPLEVEINTPHTAIQLWSVLAQTSRPRLDLARWLQTCWEL
ncbi:MAG: Asr1405/Asl0597 family protein [Cyanobacteria bacterium P01_D01_bin.14]